MFSINIHAEVCKYDDERIASTQKPIGRMVTIDRDSVCTATMISSSCFVTSGVCAKQNKVIEFNVPQSIDNQPIHPSEENIYEVDSTSFIFDTRGVGQPWSVAKVFPNKITGKKAGDIQGFFPVISKKPRKNDPIIIYQYALTDPDRYDVRSGEVGVNINGKTLNYSQSSGLGKLINAGIFLLPSILEHDIDTTSGAAGAPIIN